MNREGSAFMLASPGDANQLTHRVANKRRRSIGMNKRGACLHADRIFSILEVTKDSDHLRIPGLLLGATLQTPVFLVFFFTIYLFIFGFSKRSELQKP